MAIRANWTQMEVESYVYDSASDVRKLAEHPLESRERNPWRYFERPHRLAEADKQSP